MKIHKNIQQHSEEWFAIRKGKITGSVLKGLITPKTFQVAEGKTAKSALAKIVAKSIITQDNETFETYDMARGVQNEGYARQLYEKLTHNTVEQVGFITSDCNKLGFSPDGLIDGGFIEIKCPRQENFVLTALTGFDKMLIEDQYLLQVLFGFLVYDIAEFCDFIVYNEDMPVSKQLLIKRIHKRDYINELELFREAVGKISIDFDKMQEELQERVGNFTNYLQYTVLPF